MFGPKAANKLVGHSKLGHHQAKLAGSSMTIQQLVIQIFLLSAQFGAWVLPPPGHVAGEPPWQLATLHVPRCAHGASDVRQGCGGS